MVSPTSGLIVQRPIGGKGSIWAVVTSKKLLWITTVGVAMPKVLGMAIVQEGKTNHRGATGKRVHCGARRDNCLLKKKK